MASWQKCKVHRHVRRSVWPVLMPILVSAQWSGAVVNGEADGCVTVFQPIFEILGTIQFELIRLSQRSFQKNFDR